MRRPPTSPLFPYTTLFRSAAAPPARLLRAAGAAEARAAVRAGESPRDPEAREDRAQRRDGGRVQEPQVARGRSEEHTSELQSRFDLVCRLLLEKKKNTSDH